MLVLAVEMVVWQQDEFGPFSPADHQTMDHKDFRFSKPWLYLEKKKIVVMSHTKNLTVPHPIVSLSASG